MTNQLENKNQYNNETNDIWLGGWKIKKFIIPENECS
jgi:hypothetical protein